MKYLLLLIPLLLVGCGVPSSTMPSMFPEPTMKEVLKTYEERFKLACTIVFDGVYTEGYWKTGMEGYSCYERDRDGFRTGKQIFSEVIEYMNAEDKTKKYLELTK